MDAILIYGASGYIGRLTARAAVERGLRPVLAGRSEERLVPLASELGLQYRHADLLDAARLDRSMEGIKVLLNAAGPFSVTWQPLVEACLRQGAHYLDLTGEVVVFEAIRARGAEARRRGIVLLPGVGFDVVPSDCLAAHVAARLPTARTLRIGISGLELLSRGSAKTLAEQAGRSTLIRRNGRLVPIAPGSLERSFDYGWGPSPSLAVTWGDLSSAFNTTGIANIETYFETTPTIRAVVGANRLFGPLLSLPPSQAILQSLASWVPGGPSAGERRSHAAVIVAEAEDASGTIARGRLRTPEAYSLSAETAAAAIQLVADGNYRPGFQTPAGLYGAGWIGQFSGVSLENLSS